MKKFLATTLVLALALALCFSFVACNNIKNVYKIVDQIDYSTVLTDYLEYPDASNDASMTAVERNVTEIYNDSSLTDAQKVAQIMERATLNEIDCAYFAYFIDRSGETKMNKNHGQLIYQRLRRQSNTVKDDTTLKLPVNHNFDLIAQNTLTDAQIRYNSNGKLYKMKSSDIVYNEETGLLTIEKWKKGDKWNHSENVVEHSRNYDEARKTCINWSAENIVDSSSISMELKQDNNGKEYYELIFSIDVAVANADKTTISRLQKDNSGSGMQYQYCNFAVEIWKNGLAKKYNIKESWSGTIVAYSGSAQCESKIVFSYSACDVDDTKTAEIKNSIMK